MNLNFSLSFSQGALKLCFTKAAKAVCAYVTSLVCFDLFVKITCPIMDPCPLGQVTCPTEKSSCPIADK